jgi:hypothetical protein
MKVSGPAKLEARDLNDRLNELEISKTSIS